MDLQHNTKIQDAIAVHLATGRYESAEDVVLTALRNLADDDREYEAAVDDLRYSIADENAGRLRPLSSVAEAIRGKYGFRGTT